jgi:NAD-reducing hydrogenase large subunit
MSTKLIIDPVTRVEGHGKVSIIMGDDGKVEDSMFHIVEFRGFERFIQGHPYWEVPVLVQRLCGICPVSHHLGAAKAIDQIVGVDPQDLTVTATKLRRLLHYGQVFQSHALHFFYLASPDLLFGKDAPVELRNIAAVATANKELARKGILMRKFGQEIIKAIAGKKIHGIIAVPGGVHKTFTPQERDYFLKGGDTPSVWTMIDWSREVLQFFKDYYISNREWMDTFAAFPSGHLGLVSSEGAMDLYDGRLRAIDSEGNTTLDDIQDTDYLKYFKEEVKKWTYLKFPYLSAIGKENGWNRVGPLARLNVCDSISTPMAERERLEFYEISGGKPSNRSMLTHWARLIEMLHCAEMIKDLLFDPDVMGDDLIRRGDRRDEGIGVIEAPRGTLIHHYQVDDKDRVVKCNLIVSTTQNNEAMNRAVRWVADNVLQGEPKVTDSLLNQVEIAIRAYDPCLSCATHAIGQMPLQIGLYDTKGNLLDEKIRS